MSPRRKRRPKAIALGARFRDKVKSDADYDPIRDDPGFRKLVYGE